MDGSCTDASQFLGSNETDTITTLICNSQGTGSDPSKISWNKKLNFPSGQGIIVCNR